MTHLHVNSGSILLHFLPVQFGLGSLMPLHMVLYTLQNLANMAVTKLELKNKTCFQVQNFSYLHTATKDEVKICV